MAKHVPTRTCIICRQKTSKRALTRLVRTEQGLQIDPTGKMNGRGAYLCDSAACWERAAAGDALSRALKTALTDDDRIRLRQARPQL